jgi:O-antigen/teichoic acid export membrane protein
LRWLLAAIPLSAARELAVAALIGSPGGERRLLRVNAASVVLNVALVVPLVPVFGLVGAAVATVGTEVIRLAMAVRFARAAGFRGSAPTRYWRPIAGVVVMSLAVLAAGRFPLPVVVAVGGLAYATSLWVTGALRIERGRLPRLQA